MKMTRHKVVLVLAFAAVITVSSQSPSEKQCKGVDLKLSEEKMMNMMECIKEGGFEDFKGITKEKFPCIFTCIMKKNQVIDEKGILRKENIQQLVNEDLPEEIREDLNTRIGACFDEHGSKMSADDPMCVSSDLVDCIKMSYVEVCKT